MVWVVAYLLCAVALTWYILWYHQMRHPLDYLACFTISLTWPVILPCMLYAVWNRWRFCKANNIPYRVLSEYDRKVSISEAQREEWRQ